MVDQFIEGHARIKRSVVNGTEKEEVENDNKKVIYADVSMLVCRAVSILLKLK